MMENFIEKASIAAMQSLIPVISDEEILVSRALEMANLLQDKLRAAKGNDTRREFHAERNDTFFHPRLSKAGFMIESENWQFRQHQLLLRELNLCFNTDEECSEAVDKLNAAFVFR